MAPRRLLALAALAAAAATRAPSLEAWINDLELIIDDKFETKISGIKLSVAVRRRFAPGVPPCNQKRGRRDRLAEQ